MGATDAEQQWLLASRNGDPAAIESLIKTHQRMIHVLTYRMTGSMAEAEDLAQETFIQAFQQIENFRGDSAFSSWLYRIAMNKCLNWRKREQRRMEIHHEWSRADQNNNDGTPDDLQSRQVQTALMKLDPKQRAATILRMALYHDALARFGETDCHTSRWFRSRAWPWSWRAHSSAAAHRIGLLRCFRCEFG